jgi:hypothetical protein
MIFVIEKAFCRAYTLCATGTENLFTGIHIKKLILQRGTANITN